MICAEAVGMAKESLASVNETQSLLVDNITDWFACAEELGWRT